MVEKFEAEDSSKGEGSLLIPFVFRKQIIDRPYTRKWLYQASLYIDEPGAADEIFPVGVQNVAICFSDSGSGTDYCVVAIDGLADLHFGAAVEAYQQVARYRFVLDARVSGARFCDPVAALT